MYQSFFKRAIDFVIALIGLAVISPIFLLIAAILFFAHRGKVFFVQNRPGKNEKIFKLVKFKTMNDLRDQQGNLLPDVERITPFGNLIRKTSLDEIPQLLNVLKGDMSLIGPRPLLVEYLPLYNTAQKRRHLVRPGISGWAQVNGRNAISWDDKFRFDQWYVDHVSLALDLKIIGKTLLQVFRSEGINADKNVTMELFRGNEIH